MAIPFLNNINLSDNELQNAKLHITGTAPTSATGQIYYDSSLNVARYYDNDGWVRLTDTSVTNGTFINATLSGTNAEKSYAVDLSATGTASSSTYLRGDNTWAALPGDPTITLTGEVTGSGTTSIATTVANGVLDVANFNASAIVTAAEGIENNDNDTTLPTSASVKAYVDASVVGGLVYQGGYNAATNTPNLDVAPIAGIKKGWTYTVTADGLFFTEQVRVGDVLIAEIDSPTTLADWTTVQNNIDIASASQIGIGNVAVNGAGNKDGLFLVYTSGTAAIGLDVDSLPSYTGSLSSADTAVLYLPLYNGDNTDANEKIAVEELTAIVTNYTTHAETISATATIAHNLSTRDVIIQLYDTVTFETVYADVDRISATEATITFATTPTNPIRVLVQKIG